MNERAKVLLSAAAIGLSAAAVAEVSGGVSDLPPVWVWGERDKAPVMRADLAPWQSAAPALSYRGQGETGTLTDLSINGSTFSEAGIVFNGATLRNAQTEHFNSDLPAPVAWMSAPRVLTGLELFRRGAGHSAGSLALDLAIPESRGGSTTVGAGMYGHVFGRVDDLELFAVGQSGTAWAGAFGEAARADRSDGYESNPMSRAAVGGRFGFGTELWSLDTLFSWSWRDFGCTGAYGANEKYDAWEEDETSVASAAWKYDDGEGQTGEITLMWTRGRDTYWLKRDNPDFYENNHLIDTVTLHGAARRTLCDWAFIDLRGDADAEIYSTTHHNNYSGSSPKTKSENFRRFHGSVAVLPGVRWEDWELAAGAAGEFYSVYSGTCAPAGGISYSFAEDGSVALSYREGCRMPSYTELTYDSPDSKGTIDLPLQRTRSVNLDAEWGVVRGGMFLMRSEELVDWLKTGSGSAWKATALDPVTSFGLSGDAEIAAGKSLTFIPRGAFVLKQTETDYWASRYAMDFPVASFSLEASYRIIDGWRVAYRQGVEVWKSNPVRRGSRIRNVSRIETTCELPWCRALAFTAGVSDVFNQKFEVYPGQKALGFTGYLALTYRW